VREASSGVDNRHSDFYFLFVLKSQFSDRPGGTDLAAESTSIFAIADGGNKPGGP